MSLSGKNTESKKPIERAPIERAPIDKILEYSIDILKKKYELYMWCETKVHTLVTLDGLLIGGIFVLVSNRGISGFPSVWLVGATLMFLLTSLFLSLWHTKPLMYSGRTKRKNLRTSIGTEAYSCNQEYIDEMMNLTLEKMIELNAEQIRGMNKNIMKNQRAISWGVRLTGVAIFFAAAYFLSVMEASLR